MNMQNLKKKKKKKKNTGGQQKIKKKKKQIITIKTYPFLGFEPTQGKGHLIKMSPQTTQPRNKLVS